MNERKMICRSPTAQRTTSKLPHHTSYPLQTQVLGTNQEAFGQILGQVRHRITGNSKKGRPGWLVALQAIAFAWLSYDKRLGKM